MPQATALIEALKRELKERGITYAELARRIGMSEPSVKRMFSLKHFTLQRLDQMLSATGIDLRQLAQAAQDAPPLISQLSLAQEQEIIGDLKLLVVAVAALNSLNIEQIVASYTISEAEAVACLLRLDRIGFLELLPNNRVKLLVSRTFAWIADGPIQAYFRKEAFSDYLDANFDAGGEQLQLVNLMLSARSTQALLQRLRQVTAEFSQQHQDDARLPYAERRALSVLLAARPWMPASFKALLRP